MQIKGCSMLSALLSFLAFKLHLDEQRAKL